MWTFIVAAEEVARDTMGGVVMQIAYVIVGSFGVLLTTVIWGMRQDRRDRTNLLGQIKTMTEGFMQHIADNRLESANARHSFENRLHELTDVHRADQRAHEQSLKDLATDLGGRIDNVDKTLEKVSETLAEGVKLIAVHESKGGARDRRRANPGQQDPDRPGDSG